MARRNRITPFGEFLADSARGTMMGNRGILHDEEGRLGASRWRHPHWVACRLEFKGRRRPLMSPRAYTELFFLDEATALAAGHRPCAECRRADFLRYRAALPPADAERPLKAGEIDARLHAARVRRDRSRVTYIADAAGLPMGTMIDRGGDAWLLWNGRAFPWALTGYGEGEPLPAGEVRVLTPRPSVEALKAGYRIEPHSSLPEATRRADGAG